MAKSGLRDTSDAQADQIIRSIRQLKPCVQMLRAVLADINDAVLGGAVQRAQEAQPAHDVMRLLAEVRQELVDAVKAVNDLGESISEVMKGE